ncbi:hypothetical protein NUW58_g6245 [Xylaria curta]|uniref:Uncharacterized protein n=1 Tax=Xylaria curta TaxID=42375 RepID=A0ACC1NVU9_9PEZI|nr:hypothetical protein NUW58_g6245 [Xylaria curta]
MTGKRPSPRRATVLAICVITLFVVWYKQLLSALSQTSRPATVITSHSNPRPDDSPPVDLSSARAPFISWPLRRLCTEQVESEVTVPGLVFLCDNNSGGPGNIRNYILTCVRYAIEAGATGLQIPRIRTRSTSDKADLFKEYQPLSYMFSEEHFRDAMGDACPHISLFPSDGEGGGLGAIPGMKAKAAREGLPLERMVRQITPKQFGGRRGGCDSRDPHRYTDRFGFAFREWTRDTVAELGLRPPSWENPMLVRLSWGVLWDWPVVRDGAEVAATFGGLLRIREDILELADRIVQSIKRLAASEAEGGSGDDDEAGKDRPGGRFLGIHLRTEEDALSQWPTYENQSKGYLLAAEKQRFRGGVAYLASGSEKETIRFGKDARVHLSLKVKSKYDLVRGQELEKLKSLSWDQQALVDFAVLLKSDYFLGVSPSSFSINVALKRHLQKEGLHTRPWKLGASDKRSWLVGQYSSYWDDWLFMFDGMWP